MCTIDFRIISVYKNTLSVNCMHIDGTTINILFWSWKVFSKLSTIYYASHPHFHVVSVSLHVSVQLTWCVEAVGEARMRLTEHHQRCSRKSAGLSVKHSHQGAPPVCSLTGREKHEDEANIPSPSLHCLLGGGMGRWLYELFTNTHTNMYALAGGNCVTCFTR